MRKISVSSLKKLTSNSPMLQITYKFKNKTRNVFAKCEWFSLTGSIKDRVACNIFCNTMANGALKAGDKVVEVSSGNMGISLAAIGNLLGLKVTILMPKTMSLERQHLIKLYGAKLVLTQDFEQAFELCKKYVKRGYFCSNQFANKSNFDAHFGITAKEIYNKTKFKNVAAFVAGVGTSGTLSGTGKFLKAKGYKIVGIEPKNARILSQKPPYKHHKLQGLSDQKTPELFDKNITDQVLQITDNDAIAMTQKLCKELSLGVGISSGANFLGCVLTGQNCATVFADDNKKYLSTTLTKPAKSKLVDKITLTKIEVLV